MERVAEGVVELGAAREAEAAVKSVVEQQENGEGGDSVDMGRVAILEEEEKSLRVETVEEAAVEWEATKVAHLAIGVEGTEERG